MNNGMTLDGQPRQRRFLGRGPITLTRDGRRKRHLAQLAHIEQRIASTKAPFGFVAIPGFDGAYSISRSGHVFGHYKRGILSVRLGENGYLNVTLNRNGVGRPWELHVLLARVFIGRCPNGHEVDHKNRVKTDNRIRNLRYVVRAVNGHNAVKPKLLHTTKYRGVILMKKSGGRRWRAAVAGPRPDVGYFDTARSAAVAYDKMAIRSFGSCAVTNVSLGLLP